MIAASGANRQCGDGNRLLAHRATGIAGYIEKIVDLQASKQHATGGI
ncbi:MAG TPA: hypothetical protein VL051_12345 [Burkholderiaceae bacterium]|nr:hypothetical protein [Burkholderiaceae bacterium]